MSIQRKKQLKMIEKKKRAFRKKDLDTTLEQVGELTETSEIAKLE